MDDKQPLHIQYHLILKEGDTALYGYVMAGVDEDEVAIDELRTVYRFDRRIFPFSHTAERDGLQPDVQHLIEVGERLQDETWRSPEATVYTNSDVYSKYDYAGYFKDNPFWGVYGERFGAWFIPIDRSSYPTGPMKQDLLVHYSAIVLNYMTSSHFGTGVFHTPLHWRKVYGPWCLYLNDVPGRQAKLDDALARAAREFDELPQPWMSESEDMYAHHMSDLTGRLRLAEPVEHPSGFTVVLSSEAGDYFSSKNGRIYAADTVDDAFAIRKVQPGRYHLHAFVKDTAISDEFDLGEVEVTGCGKLDLGTLTVRNHMLPEVWRLGVYNRTSRPFVFSDQLRNYIWKDLVPDNLTYRLNADGTSGDTWYYMQNSRGAWTIAFPRPTVAAARYRLTICLSGATRASISNPTGVGFDVALNGQPLAHADYENDSAGYRSSVTGGRDHQVIVDIDASQFSEDNELRLATDGYVFYDMIKLEACETADDSRRDAPLSQPANQPKE